MNENFATLWESLVDSMPDHEAVVSGDRRITFSAFDDRAARLATALAELGVGRGDTVALYLYNGPEYLELVYAAFKLRAIPVNVNYRYLDDELVYLLDDSAAKVLVFHGSLGDRVGQCASERPASTPASRSTTAALSVEGALAYEELDRRPRARAAVRRAPATTVSSSTPAARRACPRASCGPTTTCSRRSASPPTPRSA